MKDKLYLDFDRTLFDTDAFIIDLRKVLESKMDLELFRKYYLQEIDKGFNPYHILKNIEKEENIETKDIKHNLDLLIKDANKYLYPDTIPFLLKVKDKYEIIIFTYGDKRFQKKKYVHTDIKNYSDDFMNTLISKGDNKDIDYSKSIFIDDNPYVIDSINNAKRVIRIRRDNAKYSDLDTKNNVEEVKNLLEIKI